MYEEDSTHDPMCDMDEKDKVMFLCNIEANVPTTLRTTCTEFMHHVESS